MVNLQQKSSTLESSSWIQKFENEHRNGQHTILHGNIHDKHLYRKGYWSVGDILTNYLTELGFNVIVRYNLTDGFNFAQDQMRQSFDNLVRNRLIQRNPDLGTPPPVPASTSNAPTTPPPQRLPNAPRGRVSPEEAFGQLRLAMSQTQTSIAAIIDLTDMLVADPNRYSGDERNPLMLLKEATLEAAMITNGQQKGYRNTIIFLASDLNRIPLWLQHENPYLSLVQVPRPNKQERIVFAQRYIQNFFEGNSIETTRPNPNQPSQLELVTEELAVLTEDFRTIDLDNLRKTSLQQRIPLRTNRVWQLVDFYRSGNREDPWEQLDRDKVSQAQQRLSRTVIGQPQAVEAVNNMLIRAVIGLSSSSSKTALGGKPKGVFFFVGSTGVGKTELAKQLAKLLFADEGALARFDMSQYTAEHSAEILVGAPPGYVGHEAGGMLTNRVLERPYSVLLFDEIEKAHPRVLDKFLQILDAGRLTDGQGRTAYFNQTVIIFTSNIGASDLTDPATGNIIREGIMRRIAQESIQNFSYSQIAEHFQTEVEWYFMSRIGRMELLNRLGNNIIVFDLLRPEFVSAISAKFFEQLTESAQEKYRLNLEFDDSIFDFLQNRMQERNNLLFGGRRIENLINNLVDEPLNAWIFQNSPTMQLAQRNLRLSFDSAGSLRVEPT